jgi:hypothetical protein
MTAARFLGALLRLVSRYKAGRAEAAAADFGRPE